MTSETCMCGGFDIAFDVQHGFLALIRPSKNVCRLLPAKGNFLWVWSGYEHIVCDGKHVYRSVILRKINFILFIHGGYGQGRSTFLWRHPLETFRELMERIIYYGLLDHSISHSFSPCWGSRIDWSTHKSGALRSFCRSFDLSYLFILSLPFLYSLFLAFCSSREIWSLSILCKSSLAFPFSTFSLYHDVFLECCCNRCRSLW